MCGGLECGPTLQLATLHVTTKLRDHSQGVLSNAAEQLENTKAKRKKTSLII